MKTNAKAYSPSPLPDAYAVAVRTIQNSSDLLETFVGKGGLAMLRDGTHLLALIDPEDPSGRAALQLFELEGQGQRFLEQFQSDLSDLALGHRSPYVGSAALKGLACMRVRQGPVLAVVPRDILPDIVRESLTRPGPFGTYPVLVAAEGLLALSAWQPFSRSSGIS